MVHSLYSLFQIQSIKKRRIEYIISKEAEIDCSSCNSSINLQYSNPFLNGTIGRELCVKQCYDFCIVAII